MYFLVYLENFIHQIIGSFLKKIKHENVYFPWITDGLHLVEINTVKNKVFQVVTAHINVAKVKVSHMIYLQSLQLAKFLENMMVSQCFFKADSIQN